MGSKMAFGLAREAALLYNAGEMRACVCGSELGKVT